MPRPHGLAKSRYTGGLQCHKQLGWRVHEPVAPELVPDAGTQKVLDTGAYVGEVARTHVPGGVAVVIAIVVIVARIDLVAVRVATSRFTSTVHPVFKSATFGSRTLRAA